MVGPDPTQSEFDAGEPREDHLDLDLSPSEGDGDQAASNRPAEGARVVTPGATPDFQPGEGSDFLDLSESVDDEPPDPEPAPSGGGGDLYSGVERPMLDLDVSDDQPAEPEPAAAAPVESAPAEPVHEPAAEQVPTPIPAEDDSPGLSLDLDEPEAPTPAPVEAGAEESGLDMVSDDLEITEDAPDGAYERVEEAEAMGAPEEPVAIGDDAEDDGIFAEDDLGIDFDAPAERVGPPRGAIVAAALAGAVMTAALAIVDPGKDEELLVPKVTTASIPHSAPDVGDSASEGDEVSEAEVDLGADAAADSSADILDEVATTTDGEPAPFEGFADSFENTFGEPAGEDLEVAASGLPPTEDEIQRALAAGEALALGPQGSGDVFLLPELPFDDSAELDNLTREVDASTLAQANLPEDTSGLRFVTQEDLDEIWLGTELPPRAADGRRNRLTPHVGAVRLTTDLGEVFEGQLYSIGGGEVSLSTHLGRITFESKQVESVARLAETAVAQGDYSTLPGERVRVSTPGGWIQGRLLSQDGARVTLITDSGGRITLSGADVQPMGQRSGAYLGRTRD